MIMAAMVMLITYRLPFEIDVTTPLRLVGAFERARDVHHRAADRGAGGHPAPQRVNERRTLWGTSTACCSVRVHLVAGDHRRHHDHVADVAGGRVTQWPLDQWPVGQMQGRRTRPPRA